MTNDLYLVSGRNYGADDDTSLIVKAPDSGAAEDVFRTHLLGWNQTFKLDPESTLDEDGSVIVVSVECLSELIKKPLEYKASDSAFHANHGLFNGSMRNTITATEAAVSLGHAGEQSTPIIICNELTLSLVGSVRVTTRAGEVYEGLDVFQLGLKRGLPMRFVCRWLDGSSAPQQLNDCVISSEARFIWSDQPKKATTVLHRDPAEMLNGQDWRFYGRD